MLKPPRSSVTRKFTVRNDGSATLMLGTVVVPFGFNLEAGLHQVLSIRASTTFKVSLDTSMPGVKKGDIRFDNNDIDENPFRFTIAGVVTPQPPGPLTTPPALTVARTGLGLVLAWPTNSSGLVLEATGQLPSTQWIPVQPAPIVVEGQNVVSNALSGERMFYRLKKP